MTAYIAPGLMDPEEVIASHFDTTIAEMHSRTRKRNAVDARNVAMWHMVTHQSYTLKMAGYVFDRDHSTVVYARKHVNDLMEVNKAFRKKVHDIVTHIEKITAKSNIE